MADKTLEYEVIIMLLGIGNPVYDLIQTPLISTDKRILSGCSTNACLAVTKLGEKATLIGRIGTDLREQFQQDMERYGIGYELLPTAKTGGFKLDYDSRGDRTLEVIDVADPIDDIPAAYMGAQTTLFGPILGETSLELIRSVASANKGLLILDPQGMLRRLNGRQIEHYRNPDIDQALSYFDVVKANELEAEIITHINPRLDPTGSVRKLYELMKKNSQRSEGQKLIAIVTLAEAGSIIFDGQEILDIPAYATIAKDPTGAGDTYAGGFLVAYAYQAKNLRYAGCFASAVASVMVENSGPDFPLTKEEAERRTEFLLDRLS